MLGYYKKKMPSSNNRVYHNFPGTFDGFNFGSFNTDLTEWYEIGLYVSRSIPGFNLFEPREFKSFIKRYDRDSRLMAQLRWGQIEVSGQANQSNYSNNRGFKIYVGGRSKWFKWPTSREQIEKFHGFSQNFWANSYSNSNNEKHFYPHYSNNNSRIKWEKKFVKNMPTNEAGSLNNFKDGNKVIQFKAGNINKYMSQNTFITMTKMSPIRAYNKPQTQILFKNPFTRANVKRGEIKFMVLKNAATKIQSVVRGKKARNVVQTATRRKLLANAAAKRK
jgi:hypothetical protein